MIIRPWDSVPLPCKPLKRLERNFQQNTVTGHGILGLSINLPLISLLPGEGAEP